MHSCPICLASHVSPALTKGIWRYLGCMDCGHAWLSPIPSSEELKQLYDQSYFANSQQGGYQDYVGDEELHRINARQRLKNLAGLTAGRIVDVGCAAGFFLDEARSAGWQVTGVDCSSWAIDYCRSRFDIEVHPQLKTIGDNHPEEWTAITFFQVLEHMTDPTTSLNQAWSILRPGGRLIIETWNRESRIACWLGRHWQQVTPPTVLHLFGNQSLRRAVEGAGFSDITIRRSGKKVSVGFVGNLLRAKHPIAMLPVGAIANLPWLKNLSIHYSLGDLVTLQATKPVNR